jgi:hypothetical protein
VNARLSAAAAALAAAAIATLAACSSNNKSAGAAAVAANTKTSTDAATTTADAATPTASAVSAPATPTTKSINICTAVPPATVVKLTGKPYTVASPDGAAAAGADARCAYDDVDNTDSGVTLSVFFENAETTWQAVHTGNVTDVSGVGDKAFWDNGNTLYAVRGSTLIQVNGLDAEQPTIALAKALFDALH